jgi:2-polyprenyl-3-methyl-5-hydroxy-6-metoxy-1,4-benzoquinol methylase
MAGAYLEVGPGHGMFFLHALRRGGFDRYLGIDISPTSLAATRALLDSGAFGNFSGYELILADFLSAEPPQPVAACVAGEVLEHVERPELFLRKFRQCLAPGGFIFISTCVNAPVIDHIYNFNSVEGLEALFSSAGLDVDKRLLVPHAGRSIEQAAAGRLPVSMAYVLRGA